MDLPVPGYPISEEAVTNWFESTYGRSPHGHETVAIMNAMAQRDSTKPIEGPMADHQGWETGQSAPPATLR